MADIILTTKKYKNEEIYAREHIGFPITRVKDANGNPVAFSDTSVFTVEIVNHLGEIIDTEIVSLSADKYTFQVNYKNTAAFPSGKVYHLYGWLSDPDAEYNNMAIDITLDIQ